MFHRSSIVLAVAAATLLSIIPTLARAECAGSTCGDSKGYSYDFKDDPLAAGISGATDVRIAVRARGMRMLLIRPRAQFVTEMLKSVEAL